MQYKAKNIGYKLQLNAQQLAHQQFLCPYNIRFCLGYLQPIMNLRGSTHIHIHIYIMASFYFQRNNKSAIVMQNLSHVYPPANFDIQQLCKRISQLAFNETEDYYALSTHFLNNPSKYYGSNPSPQSENINSQLFQSNSPLSGKLKQALRKNIDYNVIDTNILLGIQAKFNCSTIRVGRHASLGERWVIYKEEVPYFFLTKEKYFSKKITDIIEYKKIEAFTFNNIQDVRSLILKNQGLPENYRLKIWIYTDVMPTNYAALKEKSHSINSIVPYDMLINDPEIFRLKRNFKNFIIIIQPQIHEIIPSLNIMCFLHSYKRARYICFCRNIRSRVCEKDCQSNNSKHNQKCIYVPRVLSHTKQGEKRCQGLQYDKINANRQNLGLYNEKNMCFFNTIIQCLASVKILSKYFEQQREISELNYWNKDGTFGQVATQYGKFVRTLRQGSNIKCHMSLFQMIGRWNPLYTSDNQQDSHQFLVKILDWLKEDLNRNEQKPSYKNIETEQKSQEQIAQEMTATHMARNHSIIEQIMEGTQKSVIKCSVCNFSSTTFDTFLTLQLPMAGQKKIEIPIKTCPVFYIPSSNDEKINKFFLYFDQQQNIQGLKMQVRKVILKSQGYELQFYKVGVAENIKLLKNKNMYDILSTELKDETIFCVQKCKIGHSAQTIAVTMKFDGKVQGPSPFSRPIYLPNEIEVQHLYIKVLNIVMKCKNSQMNYVNVQTYFNKFFQADTFPFDLVIKYENNEQINVNRQKSYQKYRFEAGSKLIVIVRSNNQFCFRKLNTYVSVAGLAQKQTKNKIITALPTIEDCLKTYCKKQTIDENNWQCSKCKTKREAIKTLHFQQMPQILIISLNRFKQITNSTSLTPQFRKNQNLINYGEDLNMSKFVKGQGQHKYKLFAVANHIRLDGSLKDVRQMDGHYYAHIRTDKVWFKFDDEDVSSVSASKVLNNKNAYILFYQKIKQ